MRIGGGLSVVFGGVGLDWRIFGSHLETISERVSLVVRIITVCFREIFFQRYVIIRWISIVLGLSFQPWEFYIFCRLL